MPLTPSHMAAILPFARMPLFPAALAIGSMAPDLPYFVPTGIPRSLTHSLIGIPTADLGIGLVAFALWALVLRAPTLDFLPNWARERMPQRTPLAWRPPAWGWPRTILVLVVALLIGIVTHIVWDSFTHPNSPVVLAIPVLHQKFGPMQLNAWLHLASSIIGLVILAIWLVFWKRRTPATPTPSRLSNRLRLAAWITVSLAGAAAAATWWTVGIAAGIGPLNPNLVFRVATIGGSVLGLAAIIWCAAWYGRWRGGASAKR